jgi:filamentous hemagglutinin
VNEQGQAVDSQGNSTANTIAPIFDAEKVANEINAQVQITQAFSQQAPVALNSFAQSQMQYYLDANKTLDDAKAQLELTTDPVEQEQLQTAIIQAEQTIKETQTDYENWKEGGDYRVASNIIIAAISGGTSGAVGAVTQESLSWAADVMRQAMIEDSEKFAGVIGTDGKVWSNSTGESVGVEGDNEKVAGGRIVLDDLCANGRCIEDKTTITGYAEDEYGRVRLTISIDSLKELPEYKDWRSPLGGHQGEQGQMAVPGIQFDYAAGSFWDKLAEAYSGTHDTLNSFIWYDELGNGKKLDGTLLGKIGDITNLTNVALATPFAMSVLLPPEVWNAVFSAIKAK